MSIPRQRVLFVVLAVLVLVPLASANLILNLQSVTQSNNFAPDVTYAYEYSLTIPVGDVIRPYDYFTIYDFVGLYTMSFGVLHWDASAPKTGTTPAGLSPTDDPNITNIFVQYEGGQNIIGTGQTLWFGTFYSIYANTTTGQYSEIHLRDDGIRLPIALSSLGNVEVPTASPTTPPGGNVPEPGSLALLFSGALGLGWRLKAFRR